MGTQSKYSQISLNPYLLLNPEYGKQFSFQREAHSVGRVTISQYFIEIRRYRTDKGPGENLEYLYGKLEIDKLDPTPKNAQVFIRGHDGELEEYNLQKWFGYHTEHRYDLIFPHPVSPHLTSDQQ